MLTLDTGPEAQPRPGARSLTVILQRMAKPIRLRKTIHDVEDLDAHILRDIGLENVTDIRRALREGRRL